MDTWFIVSSVSSPKIVMLVSDSRQPVFEVGHIVPNSYGFKDQYRVEAVLEPRFGRLLDAVLDAMQSITLADWLVHECARIGAGVLNGGGVKSGVSDALLFRVGERFLKLLAPHAENADDLVTTLDPFMAFSCKVGVSIASRGEKIREEGYTPPATDSENVND